MKKRFQHVAVLKGGFSAERSVSLESGKAVAHALGEAGYQVIEIDVVEANFIVPEEVEAVFIALHGTFGEDGGVQAHLEKQGISYVGSGVESSRVSFDKLLTEAVLRNANIPVPNSAVLRVGDACTLPFPLVVKPPRQGSSVGCHIVHEKLDWDSALRDAGQYDEEILVQSFIPDREFTVGILEGEALPVVEILLAEGWYDYGAKYEQDTTRYGIPAELSADQRTEIQALALKTFSVLGARGFGRVDFRMTPQGEFFVLELNAIPGFTSHSLFPKAAAAAGIHFSVLCDRIMQTACLTPC